MNVSDEVLVATITSVASLIGVVVVAILGAITSRAAKEAAKNTKPNGGGSSHDHVMRKLGEIESAVYRVDGRVSAVDGRVTTVDTRIGKVERSIAEVGEQVRSHEEASKAWLGGAVAQLAQQGVVLQDWTDAPPATAH